MPKLVRICSSPNLLHAKLFSALISDLNEIFFNHDDSYHRPWFVIGIHDQKEVALFISGIHIQKKMAS